MSAKGCCWDKTVVESFFSTLKHELGLDDDAVTLISSQQLIRQLTFWIVGYYDRECRHSTMGYLSSTDYEQQLSTLVNLYLWSYETRPPNRGNSICQNA
jgi:transposase InsO family protein